MVVHLAEMYLIRAEARGLQTTPDYQGVADDLNMIRRRARGDDPNTPQTYDYTAADFTSDQDVIDEVLFQRGIELAQEGHRWHDLKRLGLAASTFGIDQNMTLWPIPQRKMEANENFTQNDGY